jgi:hypothetical protein
LKFVTWRYDFIVRLIIAFKQTLQRFDRVKIELEYRNSRFVTFLSQLVL